LGFWPQNPKTPLELLIYWISLEMDLSLDSEKQKKQDQSGEMSEDDDIEDAVTGIGGKMGGIHQGNQGFIGNLN